jgi:hypothetical protein
LLRFLPLNPKMLNSHSFAGGPLRIRECAAACHGELIGQRRVEHAHLQRVNRENRK